MNTEGALDFNSFQNCISLISSCSTYLVKCKETQKEIGIALLNDSNSECSIGMEDCTFEKVLSADRMSSSQCFHKNESRQSTSIEHDSFTKALPLLMKLRPKPKQENGKRFEGPLISKRLNGIFTL